MSEIMPCLWFDGCAEEAARFYVSLFPRSDIGEISRYAEGGRGEKGSVMAVTFRLDGRPFMALNGGPNYPLTPAVSFQVPCKDQGEVDRYWAALSEGGRELRCGWVTDRFGVTWQIVPDALPRLLRDPDPARAKRVTEAMLGMVKLDIAALERAHRG